MAVQISRCMCPLAVLLVASLGAASCALDVTVPVEPPPDRWDPSWNTHPDSLVFEGLLHRSVRRGLPGVVLLVRTPQGQWNGASGYARIESFDAMLPTHRHYAASVTKMYVATAVLLLAEDGLIDLDARISRFLPPATDEGIANGATATVRQVLGHTSGIPDFGGSLSYDLDTLNDPLGSFPPDRLLSYVEGQSAICSPGRCYFYSNTNYLLLALMLDHVTGGRHADVISERILQPLGLDATYYKNEPGYPLPPGLVNSYQDLAGNGRLMNVSDMVSHFNGMSLGHAGLIATSADYADFIEALLGGRLLSQESLNAMLEPTQSAHYGLGLHWIDTPYGSGIGHNGSDFGILCEVRHFPDVDATLVLLVNGGDSGVILDLFERLWDEVIQVALSPL